MHFYWIYFNWILNLYLRFVWHLYRKTGNHSLIFIRYFSERRRITHLYSSITFQFWAIEWVIKGPQHKLFIHKVLKIQSIKDTNIGIIALLGKILVNGAWIYYKGLSDNDVLVLGSARKSFPMYDQREQIYFLFAYQTWSFEERLNGHVLFKCQRLKQIKMQSKPPFFSFVELYL